MEAKSVSINRYNFMCFFKQKTAYDMRISDWSSDVCSSDLPLKRDLGLVVQFELPLVDGAQQLGCQQDAFGRGMVIGRVVENMAGTFVFRDRKSTRLNSSH